MIAYFMALIPYPTAHPDPSKKEQLCTPEYIPNCANTLLESAVFKTKKSLQLRLNYSHKWDVPGQEGR